MEKKFEINDVVEAMKEMPKADLDKLLAAAMAESLAREKECPHCGHTKPTPAPLGVQPPYVYPYPNWEWRYTWGVIPGDPTPTVTCRKDSTFVSGTTVIGATTPSTTPYV